MTVTASLVGGQSPRLVQIVVDPTPIGEAWTLTGSAGGFTWQVPGGAGVGDGEQLIRSDVFTPGNVPVTYTFRSAVGVEVSAPIVVPFSKRVVLQTLDGQRVLQADLRMGSDLLELPTNVAAFRVPGRSRPVTRYDVLGDIVSSLRIIVPLDATPVLRQVLASGAPIIYRFGEPVVDLDPVGVISVNRVSSPEVLYAYGSRGSRVWELQYEVVDNPLVDIPIGAFPWDVLDAAFDGMTWIAGFDQTFASMTWDQFDTFDWSTL